MVHVPATPYKAVSKIILRAKEYSSVLGHIPGGWPSPGSARQSRGGRSGRDAARSPAPRARSRSHPPGRRLNTKSQSQLSIRMPCRILTDSIVTTTMDGHAQVGSLRIPPIRLQDGLEDLDIGRVEDGVGGVPQRRPLGADGRVEVALEAARVVLERVAHARRAEVDGVVDERAAGDAAAAAAGLGAEADRGVVLRNGGAVAAQRGRGAVEERRLLDAAGVEAPFPVRVTA